MDVLATLAQIAEHGEQQPFATIVPSVPGLTAHIDGDYMAYFAAGKDSLSPGDARRNIIKRVAKVKQTTGAERVIMHLTAGWSDKAGRYHVATERPYQAQRKGSRKPDNWDFCRSFMETHDGSLFTPKLWTDREADDGMAYLTHTLATHKGELHVIHSADKDMRMFAGLHLSWDYATVRVPLDSYDVLGEDGLQYGHKWFWLQMLHGDSADHIPGLIGTGETIAKARLAGTKCNAEASAIVRGMYAAHHGDGWEDRFVEQAALLWMRTDRPASTTNFLTLGVFGPEVTAAAHRLDARVEEQRAYIRSLQ